MSGTEGGARSEESHGETASTRRIWHNAHLRTVKVCRSGEAERFVAHKTRIIGCFLPLYRTHLLQNQDAHRIRFVWPRQEPSRQRLGDVDVVEDVEEDIVGGKAVGFGFIGECNTVT